MNIADAMRAAGLEPPTLSVRTGAVVVTFRMPSRRRAGIGTAGASVQTPPETPPERPPETPVETPVESSRGLGAEFLREVRRDPRRTIREESLSVGKSVRAVERAVERLRKSGRLVRIGPKKGGQWKVVD